MRRIVRALTPRISAACQRLDALRAALNGPDARDALHALFPRGLRVRSAPDAFLVDAEGVAAILPAEPEPRAFPADPAGSTTGRTPSGFRTAPPAPGRSPDAVPEF